MFLFDGDAVTPQVIEPGIVVLGIDLQRKMGVTVGPVRWKCPALFGCLRYKHEQDRITDRKKQVAVVATPEAFQSQDTTVKCLCGIQVIAIDTRFENTINRWSRGWCSQELISFFVRWKLAVADIVAILHERIAHHFSDIRITTHKLWLKVLE